MQHITPNSKRWDYSDIPGGSHGQIKGPAHMVEGGHHPRIDLQPWAPRQWTFTTTRWRCGLILLKLCSHMRGAVAEQRRADFDIPALLPRVCSHIHGADAERTDLPFLEDNDGLERAVSKRDAENWVLDPFLAKRILPPLRLHSATAHVWTHVMICVKANFPPASARACVNVP